MTPDIEALTSSSNWWEKAGYVADFIVIVGIIIESSELYRHFRQGTLCKKLWEFVGFSVVVFGLLAEILAAEKSNNATSRLQGILEDEAGKEKERAANIEKAAAWRDITAELPAIRNMLKDGTGGSVTIEYVEVDPEAVSLAAQISHVFDDNPSWKFVLSPKVYSDRVVMGLHIPNRDNDASRALRYAFAAAQVPILSDAVAETSVLIGTEELDPPPVTTDAIITVGSKDAAFATFSQQK